MARLKFKQVFSNLTYFSGSLIISSSDNIPAMVVSGSTVIASSPNFTGSLTINGVNTFGDSTDFFGMDLGSY
jgi:hypothetical protein